MTAGLDEMRLARRSPAAATMVAILLLAVSIPAAVENRSVSFDPVAPEAP